MKSILDLEKFKFTLPYASEMFGIYQPLLGWKSKRTTSRMLFGINDMKSNFLNLLISKISPDIIVEIKPKPQPIPNPENDLETVTLGINKLNMGTINSPAISEMIPSVPYIIQVIKKKISEKNFTKDDFVKKSLWEIFLKETDIAIALEEVKELLMRDHMLLVNSFATKDDNNEVSFANAKEYLSYRVENESKYARAVNYLMINSMEDILLQLFFPVSKAIDFSQLNMLNQFFDPMESFNPKEDIGRVTLSPLGIVHLFREYFFEFDTFLGSPVQHIWLSPGSSLELIEIQTRKQTIERTTESSVETVSKSEKSATEQDELSDAIKEENQDSTKFGVSVSAGGSGTGGVKDCYSYTAHADASTSYGLESTQKTAKESTHKQMRQQSDKLSSEIKKNFKTTFKTITETQDTTSKRYVLQNNTPELINYELRRKMRQVGVQVQDIGTQLCWQTYVDLPGNDLGLGNLVHIGEPPDLSSLPHPAEPAVPQNQTKNLTVRLEFKKYKGDNDTNNTYVQHESSNEGWAVSDGWGNDAIYINYDDYNVEALPGFNLKQVIFDGCVEGKLVQPDFYNVSTSKFSIRLRKVNFDGDAITLKLKLIYAPDDDSLKSINAKYKADVASYDSEKKRLTKEAFIKSARERIKLASNIQPRKFEELREEEKTIVYRHLLSSLLNVGVDLSNSQTRHVMAELISSMFDVDKMLFFVASEWWVPKEHSTKFQNVGVSTDNFFSPEDVVSWGGAGAKYRPNYYITEDSIPAKLGSSLGWLLQLDGDNLRNAFLNAPWVKAVIPVKPGKELAALNWLTKAHVEGSNGLDAVYQPATPEELIGMIDYLEKYPWNDLDTEHKTKYTDFKSKLSAGTLNFTILDAITYLSLKVKEKYNSSNSIVTEKVDGKTQGYLPTDKVFENGFDPLQSGFRAMGDQFEVFDQWIEIMPTDQIVAVEVKYDPKTGMQI